MNQIEFMKLCEEGFRRVDALNVRRAKELLDLEVKLFKLMLLHRECVDRVVKYVDSEIFKKQRYKPVKDYFERAQALLTTYRSFDEKILQLKLVLALLKRLAFQAYCLDKQLECEGVEELDALIEHEDIDVSDLIRLIDFRNLELSSSELREFYPDRGAGEKNVSFNDLNNMHIERVVQNRLKSLDSAHKDQSARQLAEHTIRLEVLESVIESVNDLYPSDNLLFQVDVYPEEVSMPFKVLPKSDPLKMYKQIKARLEKLEVPGVILNCDKCANLGNAIMMYVSFHYENLNDYEVPLDFKHLDRLGLMLS